MLQQYSQATIRVSRPDDGPMALCTMGIRYLGSLSTWNQADAIFGSGNRLFHQVGGSGAPSKDHITKCQELRLEEDYVQVWGAQSIDIRQQTTIR